MGIFLNMAVSPDRIPEDQWEEAYEDALRIVDRCDLLDRVVLERNGQNYAAARKTAERDFPGEGLGIHVCGTMDSGYNMEDFYLYRRRPRCRGTDQPDNGADILFHGWYSEDPRIPTPTGAQVIWDSKTQGRAGHIPLLAVACLFADRFPDAVKISGDITAGQCRAAVRLANDALGHPIQTPVTCRAEALAQRIRGWNIPVTKQLTAFFQLFLGRLTPETGEALKKFFPQEALYQYFMERMADVETAEFETGLRDYLLLKQDLSDLLRMLVQDPSGPQLPLEKVVSILFDRQVHIPLENKNCVDPLGLDTAVDGDEEMPHEIEALMGRTFFAMLAGRNHNIPVFLPLQTIRDACQQVFPGENTGDLIDHLLSEVTPDGRQQQVYGSDDNALINQLRNVAGERWKQISAYDLREPQDLYHWHPGLTIEPDLENGLLQMMKKVRTFPVEREYQDFLASDRAERESYFIHHNRYILISDATWDHIFSRIMDDAYIYRFFLLFHVDCSHKQICDFMAPLLAHPPLIDILWAQASEDSMDSVDE